ncbi:MAG: hypothetical protein IJ389_00800 [Clostridia bacterium]|nr:hypothetical protein [Clostridia bacterium]
MKKIISALLCLMMIMSTIISTSALTENAAVLGRVTDDDIIVGDANGDGYVDMKDSLAIRQSCAGVVEVDASAADINCDGKVNAKDLLIIKKCNADVDDIENYDSNYTVHKLQIAGNDISQYSIVYHADAKYVENSYYSASTLQRFVKEATGVELPIVTEATTAHKIEMVDVTTIEGLEDDLGVENYKYEVKDGDLLIYGTRRGNMYAVYDILEDFLGYRFYFADYVYEYNQRFVNIPEGTEGEYTPYLSFRFCKQFTNAEGHYFPCKLNGTQIYSYTGEAYGTLTGPAFVNAHSYDYFWKMATGEVDVVFDGTNSNAYAAKYDAGLQQDPLGWNPCSTSDMDYATLFRGLLESIRYKCMNNDKWVLRDTTYMSFSICDNFACRCNCTDCRYIYASGTDKSRGERLNAGFFALNIYLANRACRDIKEFYEGYEEIDGELYWTGRPAGVEETGEIAEYDYYSYGYGEAIKDEYPNLKLLTFIYEFDGPHELLMTDERYAGIVPEDNLILMVGGGPCNNHVYGSGECGTNVNILEQMNGCQAIENRRQWGEITKMTGTEYWFWYYPTNYNVNLADVPNIFNIYHDYKYLVEECNFTGMFYEGEVGNPAYNFEDLKAQLAAMVMNSMQKTEDGSVVMMSFEEYCDIIKEYLKIHYGDGYEYIYEYIVMQDEAGNATNYCFANNVDYPGDMYDYDYIRENYEEMRNLILKAIALAEGDDQIKRCSYLLVNCEFLGLSAYHKDYMVSEDAEWNAEYESRYEWMFNYVSNNYTKLGYKWTTEVSEISYDVTKSPMVLYYGGGSWQKDSPWGWMGSTPAKWADRGHW